MSSLAGAKIVQKNRYVVISCSVNMIHRYPVLENKTVQKKVHE
jgi:hypothetical protein